MKDTQNIQSAQVSREKGRRERREDKKEAD